MSFSHKESPGMLRIVRIWSVLLLVWSFGGTMLVTAEEVVIKFATLAPEGTSWMNLMQEMNDDLKRQSNGQIAFRFYAGGVAGDERDVIRKIRINQLQGGAFSGFGLGELLPELRVLELPMLFRDAAEAEHVATAMFDHFATAFADRGYILLSLNEAGAVHIFSQQPLRSKADLTHAKMWTWQGDPLPQTLFKVYGITPIPLALPDVLPSLQSGLINACYGPPLGILALQWFTKVKYLSSMPITHVMGAILLSRQQWQALPPAQQTLVRELVTKYNAKATITMRQQHKKALTLLQTLGMQRLDWPDEEVTSLRQASSKAQEELTGQLYSRALLEQVLRLREQYRQSRPQ
jgi:TRAP-type C4-dicarboxylate transport system substrate-binding protein